MEKNKDDGSLLGKLTRAEIARLKRQGRLQKDRDQDLTGQDEEVFQGE